MIKIESDMKISMGHVALALCLGGLIIISLTIALTSMKEVAIVHFCFQLPAFILGLLSIKQKLGRATVFITLLLMLPFLFHIPISL